MTSLAKKITKRLSAYPKGSRVATPKDFLDFGSRAAVDQALSRLVKAGKVRRVGRGLYDIPRISGILNAPAPVSVDAAIDAVARGNGSRVAPSGATAAHALGLTNLVPAHFSYITDGPSRTIKIGQHKVRLRHAAPAMMQWADQPAGPAVFALQWLGENAARDPGVIAGLRVRLPKEVKKNLLRKKSYLPAWMLPVVDTITETAAA